MPKPSARELLNLPEGYRVRRYRKGELDVAWVDTGREPDRRRPRCGARGHVNGTAERSVSRLPVQTGPLALKMKAAGLRCPKCGRCWSDVPAIVSDVSPHVTADLADAMAYDLMDRATVTEVAARYGAGPHIATKVLDDALVTATYLPETLCIDEFGADTEYGRFAVAVTDGSEGTLCEALRDKRRKTLGLYFSRFGKAERERVRWFCCDMHGPFMSAAKRWLPNATVCIDRFHVVKTVTEAVGNVRRRVQGRKDLDAADAKEVKGSWKLLIMRRADLEELDDRYAADLAEKRARHQATLLVEDEALNRVPGLRAREPRCKVLERVLGRDEALGTAYGLMQDFYRWSDSKWSRRKRQGLYEWCNKAANSGVPEMRAAAFTLKRHAKGILAGYRHGKTNAAAEGADDTIKVLKRKSYGFGRFDRMRRRLLMALGFYRFERTRALLRDAKRAE